MNDMPEQLRDQGRWNEYGTRQIQDIEENLEKHIIRESPISHWTVHNDLMRSLGPLRGKRILELGCGLGRFSVFLAKQGATVTGLDIGADLIAASRTLANVNRIECEFRECNIVSLPFETGTFDIVLGLSVLHHLSSSDVLLALQESSRVLKKSGKAIFYEPVENSKFFDSIQCLFPAGNKGSESYRPSILQRKAWNAYVSKLDDRAMTNQELTSAGKRHFQTAQITPSGFLIRLERLIGRHHRHTLNAVDRFLFNVLPPLRYYSQTVVIEYRK